MNILKERKAIKNSKEKLVKLLDEPTGIIKKKNESKARSQYEKVNYC